jgi:hypothetical protein
MRELVIFKQPVAIIVPFGVGRIPIGNKHAALSAKGASPVEQDRLAGSGMRCKALPFQHVGRCAFPLATPMVEPRAVPGEIRRWRVAAAFPAFFVVIHAVFRIDVLTEIPAIGAALLFAVDHGQGAILILMAQSRRSTCRTFRKARSAYWKTCTYRQYKELSNSDI